MSRDSVFIHPTADVSPRATIGDKTRIWHEAQVREGAVIGRDCILGKGVYVDRDVRVGDRCKLQNGVFVYHGFNLEDGAPSPDRPVRAIEDASSRIRAARAAANAAGMPAVINARTDLYLKNIGDPESRLAETVRRAKAYLAAGADCIYPFGLADVGTIARLTRALDGMPVNIVARPDTSLPELERVGVARVSIASGATLTVMSLIKQIAEELYMSRRFDGLKHSISRPEVQKLFEPRD